MRVELLSEANGSGMISSDCSEVRSLPPNGLLNESRGPSVPSRQPRTVREPPAKKRE